MNMGSKIHKAIILFFIPLVLYFGLLPVMPLMEPDEGRYALIPQAMNESNDYVTPHLKGVVYLEKPPLGYWATALSFKIFGENEFSSRFFPALCAWGCIFLVYFMGCYFHDRKTGLYSAAILTTCLLPFALGRINILDMPLTLFLAWTIWFGFRYFAEDRKHHKKWIYLFYSGAALAFLTKGLIGLIFPFAIIGFWLLWLGKWREVFRLISPVGAIVFMIMVGPWIYFVQRANPDFLFFFFIQEHFLRYTTTMHERTEPFYYYILIILGGALPWWPYLPKAISGLRKGMQRFTVRTMFQREEACLFLAWAGIILLFFSLSSSKLASYITPIFPPLAVLMGHIIRNYEERSRSSEGKGTKRQIFLNIPIVLQSILFSGIVFVPLFIPEYQKIGHPAWLWFAGPVAVQILIIVLPGLAKGRIVSGWFFPVYLLFALYMAIILFPMTHYLSPGKSSRDIIAAVKTYLPKGEPLYQYKISMYAVDFHTGMRTPIVDDIGELKFGADRISSEQRRRYFPTAEEFSANIRQGKGKYCITEGIGHVEGLQKQVPHVKILWNNGKFYMLYLEG